MPSNKNAIIRYKYLDEMLSDWNHYYTRADLCEKCNEMLRRDGYSEVSKRTIELDIVDLSMSPFYMDIESLVINGKRIVRYKDPTRSVFSKKISDDEKHLLAEVLNTLGQFSGLDNFGWLEGLRTMLSEEKSSVGEDADDSRKIISFSSNPYLKNQNLLGGLFTAISNKIVVSVNYRKFKAGAPSTFIVYPYLLKQYNDRWHLICGSSKGRWYQRDSDFIMNLPLDRIESYTLRKDIPYKECPVNLEDRFDDIVGVTYYEDRKLERILFAISNRSVDYIRTKPLHPSQTELTAEEQSEMHKRYPRLERFVFFTIDCIQNYELVSLLHGFGRNLVVLSPEHLKAEIKEELISQLSNYTD